MTITKMVIQIANFEVIPSSMLNAELFYFPEEDPYNLNFQECSIVS